MSEPNDLFVANRQLETAIIAHLADAGYERCEPAILQLASAFFDVGEDLRSRLFLTSDISGAEYCLRPEYTVPVCRHYLASSKAGEAASYSYCGPVFRYRDEGSSEFLQAGLESFGRQDKEAADAEMLVLALEAIEAAGGPTLRVKIGDGGLFGSLLKALDLTPQWQNRILRGHAKGKSLNMVFATATPGQDHSGVLAALEGTDKQGARALVEDLLSIAGIPPVGGRSATEIADRFLEQAALKSGPGIPEEKRLVIERFLAIDCDPDSAAHELRKLAGDARLDFDALLDRFDTRLGFIAARGLEISDLVFVSRFVRNLDYYSGFVFEGHAEGVDTPIVGGGRYDNLLRTLGAKAAIPAVGAAIWIDRLQAAVGASL